MKLIVNHWVGLLRAPEGALVPEKCFWYAIDFEWKNNQYVKIKQHQDTLTAQHKHRQHVPIPRLEMSKARRTLGVCITLDGNNDAKVMYLTEMAKEQGSRIAQSCLKSVAAEYCLCNIIYHKQTLVSSCGNHDVTITMHGYSQTPFSSRTCHGGYLQVFLRAVIHGPLSKTRHTIPQISTQNKPSNTSR